MFVSTELQSINTFCKLIFFICKYYLLGIARALGLLAPGFLVQTPAVLEGHEPSYEIHIVPVRA